MRALVWTAPNAMELDDVDAPEAGPGEVLVAPEAVGICGSELEGYVGAQANRVPPLIMGHELAGRVVALGDGVDAAWQDARVAVNPLVKDPDAPAGLENLGDARRLIGLHTRGGFAELVAVPQTQLHRLPDGADARLGVLAEPFANGVHAARIGQEGIEGGPCERAAVVGAGTIGLCALQALRLSGVEDVVVAEPDPERRAAADALGARASVADAAGLPDRLDLCVDAVGLPVTRRAAVASLRPGGCAVMLGLAGDEAELSFHDLVRRGITVRGSYAYTEDDYAVALDHLLAGRAGLGELEPILPLAEGPAQFAALAEHAGARLRVFLAP